ncbi:interleukin-17A-like [Discoglossus pictus]
MSTLRIQPVFHVTLLLLILGVSMMVSVHGAALHHLKKACPPRGMKFPTNVTLSLNINGQMQNMGSDVSKRSLSPWDISLDMDQNRYPHVIVEAKCRHDGCVDSNGNIDLSINSIPIRQEILVLRRELSGCNYIFKLEKKMVTVGCTCVRPNLQDLS